MLGFGELFAHEAAFRLGWSGTKVRTLLAFRYIFLSHKRILVFWLADVEILLACFGLLRAFLDWY